MIPFLARDIKVGASVDLPGKNAVSLEDFANSITQALASQNTWIKVHDLMDDQVREMHYMDFETNLSEKKRPISSPEEQLMRIQRYILKRLPLDTVSKSAFAYTPGRSAKQAAELHIGSVWAVKVDIANFFHQIREQDVAHLFRSWGFADAAAVGYAKILTKPNSPNPKISSRSPGGRLPQGAPTSGAIANLVCFELDMRIERFATENDYVYTRYSDDILISSRSPDYSRERAAETLRELSSIIRQFGLALNHAKTKIYAPSAPKHYLGLIVGADRLRLPRHYRRKLELMGYCLKKIGLARTQDSYSSRIFNSHSQDELEVVTTRSSVLRQHDKKSRDASSFLARFVGQIVYVNQIEPELAKKYALICHDVLSKESQYFNFFNPYSYENKDWIAASLKTILAFEAPFDWYQEPTIRENREDYEDYNDSPW